MTITEAQISDFLKNTTSRTSPFKVLDRFNGNSGMVYNDIESALSLRGVFIDCETTGLDAEEDKIIQISIVPFTFDSPGKVGAVLPAHTALEDPGFPLIEEIRDITGLTDDDLAGKKFDDDLIKNMVSGAALVICHNAEFDRLFLEKRWPFFRSLRFGCSMRDVPWRKYGYASTKLEWLAFKHCNMFYESHRAEIDAQMGVHLLSTKLNTGFTVLDHVLAAARKGYCRIYAKRAPYEKRHIMKRRGYRWNNGENGLPKAWWIDVEQGKGGFDEYTWLNEEVYGFDCESTIATFEFNATQRFSNRIGR